MGEIISISDAARRFPGIRPRDISDLFFQRRLDESKCPMVGHRRVIPVAYLSEVERVLREAGKLPELVHAS